MRQLAITQPRLRTLQRQEPDFIISGKALDEAAKHIKENMDSDGCFKGEFEIPDGDETIYFDINCSLFFRNEQRSSWCTGVIFHNASASVYDDEWKELKTDFTEKEFEGYLKDIA